MPDEEKKKDDQNLGGDGSPAGDGQDPAKKPAPGGQEDKSLDTADAAALRQMVKDLRGEAATHRTKGTETKDKLDQALSKLKDLEDAKKTDEQKATERATALEAEAKKVPGLVRYADHVKADLDEEMKRVNGLKAEQKKPYTDLLAAFPEDDHLSRLVAVRALKSAEGVRSEKKLGDEGNPGEPGGGANDKTLATQLAWSSSGTDEARMTGKIK